MDLRLDGARVVVAGASRGIGRGIAERFAAEGALVAICGRDAAALERARCGAGARSAHVVDLRDEAATIAAMSAAADALGGLDIAIANAGRGTGPAGGGVGSDTWRGFIDDNLMTAVHTCEAAVATFTGPGSLVVIGSIAGLESHPAPLPYAAAKAALARYTRDLARQLAGRAVRVNMVAPGNVLFPGGEWEHRRDADPEGILAYIGEEVPMRRFGTVEEVADSVMFLASPRSGFTTGAVLAVDGGQLRT